MPQLRKAGKEIILRPVRSNAGIRAAYRRKLLALVDEMTASYEHWLEAAYRQNEPAMLEASDSVRVNWAHWQEPEPWPLFRCDPAEAPGGDPLLALDTRPLPPGRWIVMDATPAKVLERELKKLQVQWGKRFDQAARDLARYFATAAAKRSDAALRSILRVGGWTVKFQMTAAMKDVLAATVAENVALIKSIPQKYHGEVEGLVMRSVVAGRDLASLTKQLRSRYDVTRNRAELIARDQNNKATAQLQRARYMDLGIKEAIWLHSAGGKKPRPTHVKNSGKRFNVVDGWYDPAVKRRIHPGELINCRCVARPVVKGFS